MFPDAILTDRLRLRPLAEGDAPAIFAGYGQDPEVVRYLIWRPHAGLGDTLAYVRSCLELRPAEARVYAVLGREGGALLGTVHLRRPVPHRVEAGYVLARAHWGRGLMTEALRAAAEATLALPGVFRFSAVCDAGNLASARVMEKAGLAREGLLRRWLVHPNLSDEPRDCFSYAQTR